MLSRKVIGDEGGGVGEGEGEGVQGDGVRDEVDDVTD